MKPFLSENFLVFPGVLETWWQEKLTTKTPNTQRFTKIKVSYLGKNKAVY
jgi:hypothetical protein